MFVAVIQILISVSRFLFFFLGVSHVSSNEVLLRFVGYIPLFALFDVGIQANYRWLRAKGFIKDGFLRRKIFPYLALFIGCFFVAVKFDKNILWMVLVSISYLCGSVLWRYEKILAEARIALFVAIVEFVLGALFMCLVVMMAQEGVAVLLVSTMPIARIITLSMVILKDTSQVPALLENADKRIKYIIMYLLPQLFASAAATMPAFLHIFSDGSVGLAGTLISIRLLHSLSSSLSISVNAISSRIFFNTLGSTWRGIQSALLNFTSRVYSNILVLFLLSSIVTVAAISEYRIKVALIIAGAVPFFSITNLLSSLSLANNIPLNAVYCQASIFLSTAFVCSLFYSNYYLAVLFGSSALLLFFIIQFGIPARMEARLYG